jgi:lysophospholipase L1-like esterase
MRPLRIIAAVILVACGIAFYVLRSMRRAEFWESEIRTFERDDRLMPPKPGVIVFTGSSSIRFWDTLAADMKPLDVINRGFGGSQIADVNYFTPRIVLPYHPRAVVLYCGDNDLAWPASKSPERVFGDFERFVQIIHNESPEIWIYYVSIKPSTLRRSSWPKMQRMNRMVEAFARTQERVQFIDVASAMLDAQGEPRRDLLKGDGLHPNQKCYALWTSIIKPVLMQRFAPSQTASALQEPGLRQTKGRRPTTND